MSDSLTLFQTSTLKSDADYNAPDDSEIRLLPTMNGGGLAHCTLPPGGVSLAVRHKTVEEIWYFLEGSGEVWRKLDGHEQVTAVRSRDCLTIPPACHFQFRNTGSDLLTFVIATMPPWPGASEAARVDDHWPTRP
jgi:mannose-6-phosphate isomerase-like protein (cupin superfamily)